MAKPRKKSLRPKKKGLGWQFWVVASAACVAIYLVTLYTIPTALSLIAVFLGYRAYQQPTGSKRNWVVGAGVMGLIAVTLFSSRAGQLRTEATAKKVQEQKHEMQRQQAVALAKQAQASQAQRVALEKAQAQEKKRLGLLAAEKAKPGLRGKVVKVTDGDTINVLLTSGKLERVRLLGIDAPELKQATWGEASREALVKLVGGSSVRLTQDTEKRDRNGRLLAYVFRGNNFVNYLLVRDGLADLYPTRVNVKYYQDLFQAKREARASGRGVWSTSNGLELSPSAFRRGRCLAFAGETLGVQPDTKELNKGIDCNDLKKYTVVTKSESGYIYATPTPPVVAEPPMTAQPPQAQDVYYPNCSAARAAGAAPILQGEPGYRSKLDRDSDGIACE